MLRKAVTPEIFAAHKALKLVGQGMSFREAYQHVKDVIASVASEVRNDVCLDNPHIGSKENLGLDTYVERLKQEKKLYKKEQHNFYTAIHKLPLIGSGR